MAVFERYVNRVDFEDYKDFKDNFEILVPERFNFAHDVVDEIARSTPDKTALVWCDVAGRERTFTFGELRELSDRAANFFTGMGIKKGDAVMLILKKNYQFWYAILALHKIGAVVIPATHMLMTKDVVYRNNAASVKMIVCTGEGAVAAHVNASLPESPSLLARALVGAGREGWVDFDQGVAEASPVFERDESIRSDDPLLIYFTSGTSGMPKMVAHSHSYPLAHIATAYYWHRVKEYGLHLTLADTGWGKAVWGKLYGQWLAGCAVMVYDYDKFVPRDILNVIAKYRVTTFCAPPTIYRFLIREDLSGYDLSALEHCTIAGEPLNPEVYNRFLELTGHKLCEGFGQTETTLTVATYAPWVEPKPGSMGLPAPVYDVDIVDENGVSCEVGVIGEIVVRTDKKVPPGMFTGYYREADRTQTVWRDGLYHTGDTAWRDEDGYFWYVGRMDDIIKSSGYRIGPFEVESALMEHDAVVECAVTSVPDDLRGQLVKATIVLAPGYQPCEALKADIQEHVKRVTAPYKYPRIVEFVTELPKTISGKIRRVQIREQDQVD